MYILNSVLMDDDQLNISIHSGSLNYGLGLFETIKLYGGEPQLLEEHVERINGSIDYFKFDASVICDEVRSDIALLVEKLKVQSGAIKLSVVASGGEFLTMITYADRAYGQSDYERGFQVTLSQSRVNETSCFPYHKTFNYGLNITEKRRSALEGYDEVFFLNTKGYLAEGAVSNIFMVVDGVLYTPAVNCGILSGVMRDRVMKVARKAGYEVVEGAFGMDLLIRADEVFVTNSLMGMMPVSGFEDRSFDRSEYEVYKRLQCELNRSLGEDVRE